MQWPRVQFTIRRLMTVIAIVAGLIAWLRSPVAVALTAVTLLIIAPTVLGLFAHILLARPGYRLLVGAWMASLWPVLFIWTIHVAWVIACVFLGRRPRPSDQSVVIGVLGHAVILEMILAMLSPIACLLIMLVPVEKSAAIGDYPGPRVLPLLVTPLVWLSVFSAMLMDPLGAIEWLMD